MAQRRRRYYKLTHAVERVEKEVRAILGQHQSARYLEGIVLMYSLIENVLKWLVFLKIFWDKSDAGIMPDREWESLKNFCNQQGFGGALNLALAISLIRHPLYNRIERIRVERNDLVHQLYLFSHRRNRRVLRAKLERLVTVADEIFEVLNALVTETGADDSYPIFMVRRRRYMLGRDL